MKSWEQYLGRLLIALRLDSIKNKIVALAVVATLAPAVSTATLSYIQNRQALTETLNGELQSIGSQSAREVDLWIRDREYDVRVFESSFEVSENLERIAESGLGEIESLARLHNYLTGVGSRFLFYGELMAIDAEGVAVATTREPMVEPELPEDWMARLSRDEGITGEPFVDERSGGVALLMAQPVFNPEGRFLGALVATLNLASIDVLLGPFARGEGGLVDVIMQDGRRIAGSTVGEPLGPVAPADVLQTLASEGGTVEFEGESGAVLGTLTQVPRLGWAVVTQVPTREAYAQVSELRRSTTLLVAGLVVFVGLVAYVLGQFIVQPLVRLSVGAAAVARGDLSVDLPVTGGGEVGRLTEAFNSMVGQLRRSREELSDANHALREHNVELERLSMTDALTGLYNRRYVMNEIEKEIHRAGRHESRIGVLMLDVDQFKDYNDTHGHLAGDEVLTGIGRVLEDATRDHDVPGRFGGEEFIVLLPDCSVSGAVDAAERIRGRLEEEVFEGGAVTCSVGAAAYPEHGVTPRQLIAAADAALYDAKAAGRDRVAAATGPVAVRDEEAPKKGQRAGPTAKKKASAGDAAAPEQSTSVKKEAAPKKKASSKKKAAPKKKPRPKKKADPKDDAAD